MQFSRHNIISKIKDSEDFFIINLLSGNADIITSKEADDLKDGKFSVSDELISKGYLVNPDDEEKLFRKKYIDFIEDRDKDEIQIFFVSNYSCNFNCLYCYQDEYTYQATGLSIQVIDAFFSYITERFRDRKKYITLFGGEPLLPGEKHTGLISYFFEKAAENHLSVAVVTNGFHLKEYIPLLKKINVKEIQVTLDGMAEMHDKRRPLKSGASTFYQIVEGIDASLENGYPVNLRMVIDSENIENLPEMARFAINKGWTKNPLFKTQLGRNYELHHCHSDGKKLFSRVSMYEKIYDLIKKYPHILGFHRPAFSISRFLMEEGKLPSPLFDSCTGTKTEWAFDYTGKIYSCTATVGKQGEELGTFYPDITLDDETISKWEERDVLAIEKCKSCSLQLACGGGCAAVAKNKTNDLHQPDCRPINELVSLGMSLYFK